MAAARMGGHCLCRSVAFESEGDVNWVAHCHCESCRRATSSPMTTWVSVARSGFRWCRGEPRYHESSPGVRRSFCGTCGSPLTYEPSGLPDEVHVYAAGLSDARAIEPELHVFVDEQLPWFEVADELPRYATTRRGGAQPVRFGPRGSDAP